MLESNRLFERTIVRKESSVRTPNLGDCWERVCGNTRIIFNPERLPPERLAGEFIGNSNLKVPIRKEFNLET